MTRENMVIKKPLMSVHLFFILALVDIVVDSEEGSEDCAAHAFFSVGLSSMSLQTLFGLVLVVGTPGSEEMGVCIILYSIQLPPIGWPADSGRAKARRPSE